MKSTLKPNDEDSSDQTTPIAGTMPTKPDAKPETAAMPGMEPVSLTGTMPTKPDGKTNKTAASDTEPLTLAFGTMPTKTDVPPPPPPPNP